MLKIRLRRMGAIRQPHYRVVVADARAPRDGAFIENLGHYNPLTDPATIQIDIAKYEEWKKKGAQPTDAVASLVKQFNRTQRKAAAAGEVAGEAVAPAKPDARTRVASGKRAEPKAEVATAPAEDTSAVEDAPMNEAVAEATRDGGEGSEAMTGGGSGAGDGAGGQESDAAIGEAAETGGSANPGAATDESA